MSKFNDFGILETSTYWLDESTPIYALNFGNSMFNNYEVIISSQSEYELNKGLYSNLCLKLDQSYYSSELEFLYDNDKPIVIKIFDVDNDDYNKKFNFESNIKMYKTTYAFASNASINAQRLVDEMHTLNEYALSKFLDIQKDK